MSAGAFGTAMVCALLLSFYMVLVRQLDTQTQELLQGKLKQVLHAVSEEASVDGIKTDPHRIMEMLIGHAELHIVITRARTGEPIVEVGKHARDAMTRVRLSALDEFVEWSREGSKLMALAGKERAKDGDTAAAILAADRASDQRLIAQVLAVLAAVFPLALLFVVGGAWWLAKVGLRPLVRLKEASASVSTLDLSYRIREDDLPMEVRELACAFNAMLARLEGGVSRLIEFSGDLSHEMRTPISNLLGKTQVTLSNPRSAEHYRAVLESNVEDLDRLRRLVEDMLFLSQAERADMALHLEEVDLRALVNSVTDYFQATAEEKDVSIRVEGVGTIRGDRNMIQRVILNLLSNAIRHTPARGVIQVDVRKLAQRTVLTIANSGEAIPAEHLPHIFERFYRVDRGRSRSQGGTGLGLAIVRSIVLLHRGDVEVESKSGQMTRFQVVFHADGAAQLASA